MTRRSAIVSAVGNRSGTAAMEFGLVAPIMVMLMMGLGELLYGTYVNAILLGAVQKAGRDATLQGNAFATTSIDNLVMNRVKEVAPNATYVSVRENYTTFSNVDKPEPHTDKPGGTAGQYDVGECFSDTNGDGNWDADGSKTGVGGANDVAQYSIAVTYPHVFPVAKLLGWGNTQTITGQTILKNQPYAAQASTTVQTICP